MNAHFLRRMRAGLLMVLLAGGVGFAAAWLLADRPPEDAFAEARQALSAAREAEAPRYAPSEYERAEAVWAAALSVWQSENERLFVRRDYGQVAEQARRAGEAGQHAHQRARAVRDSLEWIATVEADALRDQITGLEVRMRELPQDLAWRAGMSRAQASLSRSAAALERDDYLMAAEQVREARHAMESLGGQVQATLDAYLAEVPRWRAWAAETIAHSARTRRLALVVDKMARRLYVYESGHLIDTLTVELGPSWMGPKHYEGDLSTPEGRYRVQRKLSGSQTIYHRALLIDYPNAEDRRRFEAQHREGLLPPDARIGGLIEIHGEGGRGADWTEGCIALTNADIEVLYELARVGTPVTIVGALDAPAFLTTPSVRTAASTEVRQAHDATSIDR